MYRLTTTFRQLTVTTNRVAIAQLNSNVFRTTSIRSFSPAIVYQDTEKAFLKAAKSTAKEAAKKSKDKVKAAAKKAEEKAKELARKEKEKSKKTADKLKAKEQKAKLEAKEKKKLKDLLKAPKPASAYNMFTASARANGKKFSEISGQWKDLTESEKQKYQEEADRKNAEKQELFDLFNSKPKRPATSYAAFVKQHYNDNEAESLPVRGKQLSEEYKRLTDAEKAKYAPSEASIEEYKKAFAQWKDDVIKYRTNESK